MHYNKVIYFIQFVQLPKNMSSMRAEKFVSQFTTAFSGPVVVPGSSLLLSKYLVPLPKRPKIKIGWILDMEASNSSGFRFFPSVFSAILSVPPDWSLDVCSNSKPHIQAWWYLDRKEKYLAVSLCDVTGSYDIMLSGRYIPHHPQYMGLNLVTWPIQIQ